MAELEDGLQLDGDLGIATPASISLPSASEVKAELPSLPDFKKHFETCKSTHLEKNALAYFPRVLVGWG